MLSSISPLFGAWLVSLGGPVLLLIIGVALGVAFNRMSGLRHGGPATLVGLLIPGVVRRWG